MASSAAADLSDIVLLLGNIEGTDEILKLSENSRYEFNPPKVITTGGVAREEGFTRRFLLLCLERPCTLQRAG